MLTIETLLSPPILLLALALGLGAYSLGRLHENYHQFDQRETQRARAENERREATWRQYKAEMAQKGVTICDQRDMSAWR